MKNNNLLSITWGDEEHEKDEGMSRALWFCNEYLTQLKYERELSNFNPKLDEKIKAVSAINECINMSRNRPKEDRYKELSDALEKNMQVLSTSRSSRFIESMKQICTLGLVNLKRLVTGPTHGSYTVNKIQSVFKSEFAEIRQKEQKKAKQEEVKKDQNISHSPK